MCVIALILLEKKTIFLFQIISTSKKLIVVTKFNFVFHFLWWPSLASLSVFLLPTFFFFFYKRKRQEKKQYLQFGFEVILDLYFFSLNKKARKVFIFVSNINSRSESEEFVPTKK
jgi:hypothetical protein